MNTAFTRTFWITTIALALAGCASTADDEPSSETMTQTTVARDGSEEKFHPFQHKVALPSRPDEITVHEYAAGGRRVVVGDKLFSVSASLYLEPDHTFTLYYDEHDMVDAHSGRPVAMRKLAGAWSVEADTLKLGAESSAQIVSAVNVFGRTEDALKVSLPASWVGEGLPQELDLFRSWGNVGPSAPVWSDHER